MYSGRVKRCAPALLLALWLPGATASERPLRPLRGDFNGDGHRDKASFVRPCADCGLSIALRLGGEPALLGGGPGQWTRVEPDEAGAWSEQPEPWPEDLSVIEVWQLLPRAGDAVEVQVLGAPQRLALPGLVGDALYLSASDAAIVVYWTSSGWRVYELGY